MFGRYKTLMVAGALVAGAQAWAASNFTFTATNGGTYTGSNVTSIANATGAGGTGSGAYTMTAVDANGSATLEAQVVNGSSAQYSAPYDTASHQITTNYFSTGTDAFNLTFNSAQKYLGLLAGSVDSAAGAQNLINFYDGSTLVGTISGADITSQPSGAQTGANSYYLNINFAAGYTFNRVSFSSQTPSFEFGNVVASTFNVPEPGMLGLFGLGVIGLAATRRRRPA